MRLKKYTLILIALVFFTSCSTLTQPVKLKQIKKGDYTYFKEYMNWYIKKQMEEQNIVGLSVALVDDQTIVWQKGFGYEDKAKGIKASKDTIYRAGSITKIFTAMAAMKLVEENKMDIDKPLKKYLPQFSIKSRFGSTDKITPRNIMTHHSGIAESWLDKMFSKNPIPYTSYVNLIKNEYVAYPPNTIFNYSNLAVTLLGHAVEKTSNTPYSQFIQTSFLDPMNMKNSSVKAALEGKRTSKSYANGQEANDEYPESDLPAGSLNSSVSDLANLAIMINNNGKFGDKNILQKNTLEEMLKVQNQNIALDLDSKVGLGFFINDRSFNGKDRIYSHGGLSVNHHAFFGISEKSKLSIVVMTNTSNAKIWPIISEMGKEARKIKTGQELSSHKQVKTKVNKSIDLEGTYASKFGKFSLIKKDDDIYHTKFMGKSFQLERANDNKYYAKYLILGFIPINIDMVENLSFYNKNIDGKTIMLYEDYGKRNLFAVKVKSQVISSAWKNRLGTYHIINQLEANRMKFGKSVLRIEDDLLIIEFAMKSGGSSEYILEIVNDNEVIIQGIGRGMRETISVKDGILHYMGLQFKKVNML